MSPSMDKQSRDNEVEIDLLRLLQIFLKHAWLISIVTLLCAAAAYLLCAFVISPTYRSSFTAYVNNRVSSSESGGTTTSDLNASISLTYLYQDIIVSRSVLMDAADACGIEQDYDELHKKVSTSVSENSGLITVFVVDADPVLAMDFATAIAECAPAHVERMRDGSSMRILDDPMLPTERYEPNNFLNTLIAGIIGFILSTIIVFALDIVNDVVRSADELEQRYHIVVIGTIPDLSLTDNPAGTNGKAYGKGENAK